MVRRFTPLIALIALLVVAEPLLHTHPLEAGAASGAGNTACAVCATGIGRLPSVAPIVVAPQLVEYTVASVIRPFFAADAPLPRSPRAPPAA